MKKSRIAADTTTPKHAYNLHQTLPNKRADGQIRRAQQQDTTAARAAEDQAQKKRFWTWKKGLLLLFATLITPLLIILGWDLKNFSNASEKLFGTRNVSGVLIPSELKKSNGRVNILLVGYSADDPGHAGALLTDSIMVLSIDPKSKQGYMLSIPRDLYVSIPDYGRAKINEAYQAGEQNSFSKPGYPSGGMGQLQSVITENFGIGINYSAIINYSAVRDIVDALGGITVTIQSPDPRGIYDPNFKPEEGGPLKLANGAQTIDGQTALRLTRARGATYGSYGFPQSDFNRTQNQQQVLAAIKKELDWKLVLDPRTNEKIFNAVANNVKTDVSQSELLPLYRLFTAVPTESLRSVNLRDVDGVNLLASYTTPTGQSALIPAAGVQNFSDIQAALRKLEQ